MSELGDFSNARNRGVEVISRIAVPMVVVVALVTAACASSTHIGSSAPPSSSPVVSPSPEPSPSHQVVRMSVAGTGLNGSPLQLTAELPAGWESFTYGARRGTSSPPAGMAFIVSLVDNTFENPCSHLQRSPKIGSTVDDLTTALGEVPNTTASDPVKTTIAGLEATYLELAIPASLPCEPSQFYLWQDSPDEEWWVQGLNETARVWILDVGGQRVALLAHTYAGSGEKAKAELHEILNSIVFEGAS